MTSFVFNELRFLDMTSYRTDEGYTACKPGFLHQISRFNGHARKLVTQDSIDTFYLINNSNCNKSELKKA